MKPHRGGLPGHLGPGSYGVSVLLAVLAASAPGQTAEGQGSLLHGRVYAEIPEAPGLSSVQLDYALLPDPGTEELGVSLLLPGVTTIQGLEARTAGRSLPLELEEVRPRYWRGTLSLPPDPGDSLALSIRYAVRGGVGAWRTDPDPPGGPRMDPEGAPSQKL